MRGDCEALRPLLALDGEAIFDEPWQAEALALADSLVKSGMFSATAWSVMFGKMLKNAETARNPDTSVTYYNAVLAALEELVADHSEIEQIDMRSRRKDWEAAYLSTPHGQPVRLKEQ